MRIKICAAYRDLVLRSRDSGVSKDGHIEHVSSPRGATLCPGFANHCPSVRRGHRECRAPDAPAALRAKVKKHASKSPRSHRKAPGIPRAMVLTVSFVVSPETGLYCLRPRCDAKHRHQVDTSVGVSGRYDFAVRLGALRRKHLRRPSHPAPTFVTIAKRPSWWRETRGEVPLICPTSQPKPPRHIGTTGKSLVLQ
jgi:hypothetical protein